MSGAMSGVTCHPDVRKAFEEKLKPTVISGGEALKFIICKIGDDKKQIVLLESGKASDYSDNKAAWDVFASKLPDDDARYGIFKFEEPHNDTVISKIVLMHWAPDAAPIKAKMLSTSSFDALKSQLNGINVEIQATDASEKDHKEVFERIKSKSRA